ncbi:MAG: hypothetical protein VB144_12845 [Clostridia bacterium]|nr:hypothetical protein [Clostridia bacterium]
MIPLYIGKTHDLLGRWSTHVGSLNAGKGSYSNWRRTIPDASGKTRMGLYLMAIPQSAVKAPAIPGFPTTIGSLEYQIISLSGDAYPGELLNEEGNRR